VKSLLARLRHTYGSSPPLALPPTHLPPPTCRHPPATTHLPPAVIPATSRGDELLLPDKGRHESLFPRRCAILEKVPDKIVNFRLLQGAACTPRFLNAGLYARAPGRGGPRITRFIYKFFVDRSRGRARISLSAFNAGAADSFTRTLGSSVRQPRRLIRSSLAIRSKMEIKSKRLEAKAKWKALRWISRDSLLVSCLASLINYFDD
jgi:hypothetical protein